MILIAMANLFAGWKSKALFKLMSIAIARWITKREKISITSMNIARNEKSTNLKWINEARNEMKNARNVTRTQPVSHRLLLLLLDAALLLCQCQSPPSASVSCCRLPSASVGFCQSLLTQSPSSAQSAPHYARFGEKVSSWRRESRGPETGI